MNKNYIILAVRKEQDLENLFNFYGINSLRGNFTQQTDVLEDLVKVGLIDNIIFNLKQRY